METVTETDDEHLILWPLDTISFWVGWTSSKSIHLNLITVQFAN